MPGTRDDRYELLDSGRGRKLVPSPVKSAAQELGLPMTAGSDIHHTVTFETAPMGGMQFEEKLTSVEDYAQAVIAGKGTPVVVYPDKVLPVSEVPEQCTISKQPTLPVYWH